MKKKFACLFMVMVMTLSLAGCSDTKTTSKSDDAKATVESVLKDMTKASNKSKGSDATATVDINATINESGESADFNIKGTMDVQSTLKPVVSHIKTDLSMKVMEYDQAIKYEIYTSTEGDKITTYENTSGKWSASTSSLDKETKEITENISNITKQITKKNIDKYFEDVKLSEKDGCYVVSGTMTSDGIKKISKSLSGLDSASIDTESIPELSIPISLSIDKKTKLPKELTISCTMEETKEIKLSKCDITMKFNSYDVDEITIPDEALKAAE